MQAHGRAGVGKSKSDSAASSGAKVPTHSLLPVQPNVILWSRFRLQPRESEEKVNPDPCEPSMADYAWSEDLEIGRDVKRVERGRERRGGARNGLR